MLVDRRGVRAAPLASGKPIRALPGRDNRSGTSRAGVGRMARGSRRVCKAEAASSRVCCVQAGKLWWTTLCPEAEHWTSPGGGSTWQCARQVGEVATATLHRLNWSGSVARSASPDDHTDQHRHALNARCIAVVGGSTSATQPSVLPCVAGSPSARALRTARRPPARLPTAGLRTAPPQASSPCSLGAFDSGYPGGMLAFILKKFVESYLALRAVSRVHWPSVYACRTRSAASSLV